MPSSQNRPPAVIRRAGFRVYLRPPHTSDASEFLTGVEASRELHRAWVQPPSTRAGYRAFLRRYGQFTAKDAHAATHVGMLVCRHDDEAIVGVIIISEVVRGVFKSAYLGYYAFSPHHGAGYMSEGIDLALSVAFQKLKLHRVEANVQPTNRQSLRLVRRAGFAREGYSRRYVRIGGRWRDHVRMALLVEDWRAGRKRARR